MFDINVQADGSFTITGKGNFADPPMSKGGKMKLAVSSGGWMVLPSGHKINLMISPPGGY